MYYRIILLLILILSFASTSIAQEQNEVSCTPEEYQDYIQVLIDVLNEYKPQIVVETDALEVLIGIEMAIDGLRANCTGGSFAAADYSNGIIGPISFSGTLYQAEFTTTTFGTVTFVEIDGDCGMEFMSISEVDGDSETDLWEFGGDCVTMFEVQGGGDWTLNIEKLR